MNEKDAKSNIEFKSKSIGDVEKIQRPLEDYEDIIALRKAKEKEEKSPTISLSKARKLLELD